MSQAKAYKLREYGTDVISHDLSYAKIQIDARSYTRVRNTDTYKSKILEATPAPEVVPDRLLSGMRTAQQVHAKSRERVIIEKPLTAKILRTSYQDSNIFGYKDESDPTVQSSAKDSGKQSRLRNTGTFKSKAFDHLDGTFSGYDEAVNHPSTTR